MVISSNHIYFFISYAVALLAFGLIGKWYLWPASGKCAFAARRPGQSRNLPLPRFWRALISAIENA